VSMYQIRNIPTEAESNAREKLRTQYLNLQNICLTNIEGDFETEDLLIQFLNNSFHTVHFNNVKSRKILRNTPLILRLTDTVSLDGVECTVSYIESLVTSSIQRNPECAHYVIHYDSAQNKNKVSSNLNPNSDNFFDDGLTNPEIINLIQHIELICMVKNSGVVIQSPKNHNFVLPSNAFTNVFYRTGNIQQRTQNLEVVYFWLRPYLFGVTHIISESWSISTLLYFIAKKKRKSENVDIEVEFLNTYFDEALRLGHFTTFLETFAHDKTAELLVIFSATMTGASFNRVKSKVETDLDLFNPTAKVDYISVVSLDSDCCSSLLDLSQQQKLLNKTPNPMASNESIMIDKSLYVPLLERPSEKALYIKHSKFPKTIKAKGSLKKSEQKFVKNNPDFFQRYGGHGLFSVHRNTKKFISSRERHHAYYVDFNIMAQMEEFGERARNALNNFKECKNFDLVIFSESIGNHAFYEHISSNISDAVKMVIRDYTEFQLQENKDIINSLSADSNILILEGAAVTGDTLSGYQIELRRTETEAKVHFLVGLARPDSDQTWSDKVISLQHGEKPNAEHTVIWVEKILLPNLEKSRCSWCREMRAYEPSKLNNAGANVGFFAKRLQQLNTAMLNGLSKELFFSYDISGAYKELNLTAKSVFFDVSKIAAYKDNYSMAESDAEVMCAAASAIQAWRTDPKNSDSFLRTLIDRETLWGENRYSDNKIRAAIWRSLIMDEVMPRKTEQYDSLEAFLREMFLSRNKTGVATDLTFEAIFRFPALIDNIRDDLKLTDLENNFLDLIMVK